MGEVLVTGGTGVLGRRVVARLVEAGSLPIIATPTECRRNPRARSAKLRCGVKRAELAA